MRKLFYIALLLQVMVANAQSPTHFQGSWQGTLDVGVSLRLVFNIAVDEAGNPSATMDSPDQASFGIPCDSVIIRNSDVTIVINRASIRYSGSLVGDTAIIGTFSQGRDFPLTLKKVSHSPVGIQRPQTPKPPFPYKSEDITYKNASLGISYAGTITIPEGKGPFPTVILISGSGPQDRDETIFGHKPFAVIADALTKAGIIVLRVDDRGIGSSTGDFATATSKDFADDVHEGLNYLLTRPEVDKKRLGMIGHSEGGMIAPYVAAQRKDIGFLVLLAAPGIPIDELMTEQNAAILASTGVSQQAIDSYTPLYKNLIKSISSATDSSTASNKAQSLLDVWYNNTDPASKLELQLHTPSAMEEMRAAMVNTFTGNWFRYFINFDPQPFLKKLKCPVLALNGSKDIQVLPEPNLKGIKSALEKARNKKFTIKQMEGLNHLFQTCTTCTIAEYAELEESFSPEALRVMREWILEL